MDNLGLVLRLRPWGESDVLLDLFSEQQGRITALAKGAQRSRKRFMGLLLSAQLLDIRLKPGRDIWILEAAQLLANFLGLRQDYRRWLAAAPILEIMLRGSAPSQPAPACLYLALQSLRRVNASSGLHQRQNALLIFINRFLWESGFGLYLEKCLDCQDSLQRRPASLSLRGGALCPACAARRSPQPIMSPPGLISGLLAGQKMPLDSLHRLNFTRAALPPALSFISAFIRQMLGHDLLALNFIREF